VLQHPLVLGKSTSRLEIRTHIGLESRGHFTDVMLLEALLDQGFRGQVVIGRRPRNNALDGLSGSPADSLDVQGMQPRVLAFDNEYGYGIKGDGRF
jgi:hypothetical protein